MEGQGVLHAQLVCGQDAAVEDVQRAARVPGRPEGMGAMALSVTTPVQTALCSGYARRKSAIVSFAPPPAVPYPFRVSLKVSETVALEAFAPERNRKRASAAKTVCLPSRRASEVDGGTKGPTENRGPTYMMDF